MNRFVRSSPQRSQLLSAVLSAGAVAVVAVAFAVAGVDDVEVLATLFFAPVFIAALWGGRNAGYAAAGLATLGYLALRYGDIGDSGALRVGLLVAARAVCYGVVAQATPTLQQRFVGLSGVGAFGKVSPRHSAVAVSASALAATAEAPPDEAMHRPHSAEQAEYPDHAEYAAHAEYPEHLEHPVPAPVPGAESDGGPAYAPSWADPWAGEAPWGPQEHASLPARDPEHLEHAEPVWSAAQDAQDPAWSPEEGEPVWSAAQDAQDPAWSPEEGEPVWSAGQDAQDPAWSPEHPEHAEPVWSAQEEWGEAPIPEPVGPIGTAELEPAPTGSWDAPVEEAPDLWRSPPEPVGAAGAMAEHGGGWPSHAASPPPPPTPPDSPLGRMEWDDPQSEPAPPRFMGPPAPTVPTGWVDDATVPLGDETIPVGYTGELFLPRELRQPNFSPPASSPRNGSANGAPHPPSPPFDPVPASMPGPGPDPRVPTGPQPVIPPPPGASPEPPPPGSAPYPLSPSGRSSDELSPADPPPFGASGVDSPSFGAAPADAPPFGAPAAEAPVSGPLSVGTPPSGPLFGGPPGEGPGHQARDLVSAEPPGPPPPSPRRASSWRTGSTPAVSDTARTRFATELPEATTSGGVDPETRLWNARFFRDRLSTAREESRRTGSPFSVVMVQVSDQPFQSLPYRRQVALLRELGHQFLQARLIDHLVHLPDGAQHWFAVVLPDAGRTDAHLVERRLRSAIASYLRSRGLHLTEVQSASLTSPDDDEAMGAVWASLLGTPSVG